MRLVLMRHGETDWNVEKRIQGIRDIPLNEKGIKQIQEISKRFLNDAEFHFSGIITSPLMRAKQSASICCQFLEIPIEEAEEFQERRFGRLEGKTIKEIQREYQMTNIEEIQESRYGMEDMTSVAERIQRGLHRLSAHCQGQSILLVTHGSIIKQIAKQVGMNIGIIGNADFLDLKPSMYRGAIS